MSGSPLYGKFLSRLKENAEEGYAAFHKRLLKDDSINVLGVRVPVLRKLAKEYKNCVEEVLSFPDEYYEVTFVKLQAVALLSWCEFIRHVDKCVALIDNWATCDCFAPKCISAHKEEFLPYIYGYLKSGREFYQRFALTTLLHFYVSGEYIPQIFEIVEVEADLKPYYVHMAAAWLIAEVAVKYFDECVNFLKANVECYDRDGKGLFEIKTHNKAIQKACESYRLTQEQKALLKSLKR